MPSVALCRYDEVANAPVRMAKKTAFYEIDQFHGKQWHLAEPTTRKGEEIDIWAFVAGRSIDLTKFRDVKFDIQYEGPRLDFTLAAFDIPVVTKTLGEFFDEHCGECVQRIPVTVGNDSKTYEILNVICQVACFDYEASEWDPMDEEDESCREVGGVEELAIVGKSVDDDTSVFRVEEWTEPIVLREAVKSALSKAKFSGFKFLPVKG